MFCFIFLIILIYQTLTQLSKKCELFIYFKYFSNSMLFFLFFSLLSD